MVNGNYVLYGDRPSSESEIVDDHVQTRTAERKNKRKSNRNANDLQRTLNMAQLDNDTDSVKYEKKAKEPKLLRYVPTSDVKENFVTEKFETYDLKPSEEPPRRYAFHKKPRNPTDGSVNYSYSRSSSSCSSPNANLPTISEHSEQQYGNYRIQPISNCAVSDIMNGYEKKMDKYFTEPKDIKSYNHKASYEGSHPDSLYRVQPSSSGNMDKVVRVLRMLRWPVALVAVCIALALFVYFLMPDNIESQESAMNSTQWNSAAAHHGHGKNNNREQPPRKHHTHIKKTENGDSTPGIKTPEIDFYEAESDIKEEDATIIATNAHRVLPIKPVYPEHLAPEVQYGNEKADTDKLRTAKALEEISTLPDESTLKPHITRKFEIPIIYFKDLNEAPTTETITRAQIVNAFANFGEKQTTKKFEIPVKSNSVAHKDHDLPYKTQNIKKYNNRELLGTSPDFYLDSAPTVTEAIIREETESEFANIEDKQTKKPFYKEHIPAPEIRENIEKDPLDDLGLSEVTKDLLTRTNFTSGHSNLFGISIEDAEKMRSSTQSSLYNTRVSPTLPTWRDGDSTTINYPTNVNYEAPQCRSTHLALCRGVLPYDLAGSPVIIDGSEATAYMKQFNYLVASNCSERARHFVCALLEPECNPAPYPPKMPCYNLCKSVVDSCFSEIPRELSPMFTCERYSREQCAGARAPCGAREAACSDGSCIQRDWLCDGNKDCPGGEDEIQCSTCLNHEFRCESGGCVLRRWLCDGYEDCPRGEDEAGCARALDPGSEAAGSVARPHRVPPPPRTDESKEILMTSDTSNGFRRNFTRRPSKSRLAPYTRATTQPTIIDTTQDTGKFNDEAFMDDLGLFGDITKKEENRKPQLPRKQERPQKLSSRTPPPVSPRQSEATKLDKSINRLEKVLDGAALLKDAQAQEQAQEEQESLESNSTVTDKNEEMLSDSFIQPNDRYSGSAHRSPCPAGELRCVDGRCITLAQLCDGTIDCSDHADEDNCYT